MNILPDIESLTVEFKSSFKDDVIETLVAFSNTKGGTVYIGISDTGKAQGVHVEKETVQQWINEIKTKTSPHIIPDAEVLDIENKTVVAFFTIEYPIKPVSTRGKYYKRVGNSNHLLSTTEVANIHLQTIHSSWDYYPRPNKTLHDISLKKVEKAMNIIKRRDDNLQFESIEEFLKKNELLFDDNKISNGCFLMFSEGENLYSTIQMGHFASEIVIKDDVVNSDDILTQIDEVMLFIRKHISKELIITGKQIENIQRWQYPLEALREIVLNMIIHRDYTASSNSIIKIFSDHILFFNPGILPDSITIEQLKTNQYISTPRNRQIAKMAKEMGIIERYGTGIRRVRNMFIEYGLDEPQYEMISGGMAVTVFGLMFEEENKKISTNDSETVKSSNQKSNQKSREKSREKILNLIENNTFITLNEIADATGLSIKGVEKNIQQLKDIGLIERIGADKGGYWKVKTEGGNVPNNNENVPENVPNNVPNVPNNVPNVPENVPDDYENVPEKRVDAILKMIVSDNFISIQDLANLLSVNIKTVKRDISKLKDKGLIERIGAGRGGHWKIHNSN